MMKFEVKSKKGFVEQKEKKGTYWIESFFSYFIRG